MTDQFGPLTVEERRPRKRRHGIGFVKAIEQQLTLSLHVRIDDSIPEYHGGRFHRELFIRVILALNRTFRYLTIRRRGTGVLDLPRLWRLYPLVSRPFPLPFYYRHPGLAVSSDRPYGQPNVKNRYHIYS